MLCICEADYFLDALIFLASGCNISLHFTKNSSYSHLFTMCYKKVSLTIMFCSI